MCIHDEHIHGNTAEVRALGSVAGLRRWRDLLNDTPDLRMERVIRIRSEIGDGSYDEQAGLDTMIDRMSNDLAGIQRG